MNEKQRPGLLHEARKIFLRFAVLLGATVLISVLYKGMIALGAFQIIVNPAAHYLVFCTFELLLLGVYWHGLYIFSKKCRHRTKTKKTYYFYSAIVFALFSAVYWLTYRIGGRELFLWVFRMTVNLIGIRMLSTAPDNLVPYMLAYLAVSFAIMMLEPYIAKLRYKARKRRFG